MAYSTSKHILAKRQAKKNLTKVEYKLFQESLEEGASKISRRSLNSALLKTEMLVRKYRRFHKSQTPASLRKAKTLEIRLKILAQAQKRFSKKLEYLDHKDSKAFVRNKGSALTAQPKMHVELKDSPRNKFLYQEKKKIYADHTKEQRRKDMQNAVNSKRVAGFVSARSRKGQVARDRITSAKEEN